VFADILRSARSLAAPSLARLGLAELMLVDHKPDQAITLVEEMLGQIGAGDATLRAGALELLVRAQIARHDVEAAVLHLEELEHIAELVGAKPLRASAALARAALLREFGELSHAVNCFERAVRLFESSGASFETARARAGLAEVHAVAGRRESAEREARLAIGAFESLGAAREAERVRALLESDEQ
jgi:tetratricopeptide (TPR) repeat protein